MAGSYVEELVAFLGWEVDSKELTKFNEQAKDVTDTIKGVAVAVTAAAVGLTAFVMLTNKATTESYALAQSVGVSADILDALTNTLRPLGMQTENVVDLIEEMNNKIGESTGLGEPMTAVAESTKILGLEFQKLKQMAPEEQFLQILDSATRLKDSQQAVSAVDMLMGGEANKIVGYLRTQDQSILELIAHQMRLNFVTDEGRDGAVAFGKSLNDVQGSIGSMGAQFSGLVGAGLTPLLDSIGDLIKNNRELIKSEIKIWADRLTIALKWLWQGLHWLWLKTNQLVDTFGGFENMAKLIGIAMAAMFSTKVMMLFASFINMVKAATLATTLMNAAIGLTPVAVAAVIALLFLLGEDLYQFFTGGESLLGDLGEKIAEFASMNIRPFIASLLGMTPEELDLAMVRVVNSVTDFFTKSIPEAYAWLVEKAEQGIGFIIESVLPVAEEVFVVFKDMWSNMIDYLWAVGEKVVDAIVWPFKKGFELAKGILSSLPGGDALGSLLPGSGAGASTAGVGASNSARAAAASVVNNRNASSSVNQATTINVTQLPGESGEGLARRIKETIGGELRRAVVATQSGVE